MAAPLAPVNVLSRTTVLTIRRRSNEACVSLIAKAERPIELLVYQGGPCQQRYAWTDATQMPAISWRLAQSKKEFLTDRPKSSPFESEAPNFVAASVMKAPWQTRQSEGSVAARGCEQQAAW